MGLPFISRRRSVIWAAVPCMGRLWMVPETACRMAYSGRAPKTEKETHWLVPLRQAVDEACWPSVSGPTANDLAAMPLPLVMAAVFPWGVMPRSAVCQATACPPMGTPLFSTKACTVQLTVEPAATESLGDRAASVGGFPPVKSVRTVDPLLREAVTVDQDASAGVTFRVARPSPAVVIEQVGWPQARVALPPVTE